MQRFSKDRRNFIGICAGAGIMAQMKPAGATLAPLGSDLDSWLELRPLLFGQREIGGGEGKIRIETIKYPPEPGDVPVSVYSTLPQTRESFIKKHTLIVDDNPSPVAAVIAMTPENGKADFSTHIRVHGFSFVRIISELNDGRLLMDSARVYVSGGCSGTALESSFDADSLRAIEAGLGRMELYHEDIRTGVPTKFTFRISHPNFFQPAYFIKGIRIVDSKNRTVLAAAGDVTFSQNPEMTFYYTVRSPTETFKAVVHDSKDLVFENQWQLSSTV